MSRTRIFRLLRRKRIAIPLSLFVIWVLAWFALPFAVPLPQDLLREPEPSPQILDRNGIVIARPTFPDFTRRDTTTLEELPPDFIAATLAAEDKRFFSHSGIDLLATTRALRDLILHRKVVSGASTITQQLIKISKPSSERNLKTKLYEFLAARRLEMTRSKAEILTGYLNRLDYGNRSHGPREAARFYFQKPLADLSLAECALLVGLPQAPGRLNPLKRPEAAITRRNTVLQRLMRSHYDLSRTSSALIESPTFRPLRESAIAPWLATQRPHHGTLQTTLDLTLQSRIETIVRTEIQNLRASNLHQAAVVVIDNASGEILALVSSANWDDPRGGQINGTLTPRSPGSTLKPFTYLLAFRDAGQFPGTIIPDIPTRFLTPEGFDIPSNYDHTFRGPVTIRSALACSLNIPAIRELDSLGGPAPLAQLLKNLGITTLDHPPAHYGLGLTLGNAPVRLLELTDAYSTLARGGLRIPAHLYPDPSPTLPQRLFPERDAWLIADILSDIDARAPSFNRNGPLTLPFRCAVKTGTSSDFHDNWCIGFTPEFTVGVWAGNFDQTPIQGLSGVAGAGPIFHRTLLAAHDAKPPTWFHRPNDIIPITIDPRSGNRVTEQDPKGKIEFTLIDRAPLFQSDHDLASDGTLVLDSRYTEWFHSAHNRRRSEFSLAESLHPTERLAILSPTPNITCLLDPELPSGGKTLRLISNLPAITRWSSPTLSIRESDAIAELTPGVHQLTATDTRNGESQHVTIRVESW